MRLIAVTLCLISLLVGCAQIEVIRPQNPQRNEATLRPPVDQIAVANIGDTLIVQGRTIYVPAIKLLDAYESEWIRNGGIRCCAFVFARGAVLREVGQHNGVPIFVGHAAGGLSSIDGLRNEFWGIGVRDNGRVEYVYGGGGVIAETPGRVVNFEKTQIVTETNDTFQQHFIYGGRNADSLFFTYREYSGGMARPAFTQDVTYSLRDGSTIGFKSLRIEVIQATNMSITYRVVSAFQ